MFSSFLHNFLKLASSTALFATAIVAPTGARADGRADTVWMRGGHSGVVGQIAYSPDGQTFVTASDDLTVKIWRVADRQLIRTLIPLGAPCSDIAFSPDGRMLALATRKPSRNANDLSTKLNALFISKPFCNI